MTTRYEPDEIRPVYDGELRLYSFRNGYGASVLRHMYSHGGSEGFYELAVLGRDGRMRCDTPVSCDVVVYANDDEIAQLLSDIAALPPAP
jgi:hypothetical protein